MPMPRPNPVLLSWCVISLRPVAGHDGLRRAAAAWGARLFALSSVRLVAMTNPDALAAAMAAPQVIFTSPAAVRFARQQGPLTIKPGQRWFAVGRSTANALHRAGVAEPRWPVDRQTAEGLLDLPEFQSLQGASVGLVTAPGGREWLAATLAARGARVIRAEVYRREPVTPATSRLQALFAAMSQRALLVTSAEAFDGLWRVLSPERQRQVCQWPVVVSSARLAEKLRAAGFATIIPSGRPDPRGLLDALAAHVGDESVPVR